MNGPDYDAIVVGAGHNGLVTANLLADAGWSVLVLEADDAPGGAVRSAEVLGPGFITDLFSAFYPLGAASPVLRALRLEEHGLRWSHAPAPLAHLLPDDRAVVLSQNLAETAASVERSAPGDGAAWQALVQRWDRHGEAVLEALFSPFPPVRAGTRLLARLGPTEAIRLARFATLPVRRLGREQFRGEGAQLLLAGTALHSDMSPEEPGSGLFGWPMTMVGQRLGFPVPQGGSGMLIEALARRLQAAGGELRCGERVERIMVVGGRARGVQTTSGRILARRAVIADIDVPTLYLDLVGRERLPDRFVADLRRFDWDPATLKLSWALSGPIPWTAREVAGAGTIHFGGDLNGLTDYAADLATGRRPRQPFVLLGQMSTTDPTRSPAGRRWSGRTPTCRARWAATRPRCSGRSRRSRGCWNGTRRDSATLVTSRVVQAPVDLADADANLVGGAINGGTTKLYQELVFRLHAGHPRLRAAAIRLALGRMYSAPARGILPPPVSDLPDRFNRGGEAGGPGTTG